MSTGQPLRPVSALTLRAAVPADVEALTRIYMTARATSMTYLPDLYSTAEIRDWIGQDMLATCAITVGLDGSTVAGFSAVRRDWLEQLYVDPARQCRGLGSTLLTAAQRASAGTLRLHVFQQNLRARQFYARHGFRVEHLRDGTQNEEGVADMVCLWQAGRA